MTYQSVTIWHNSYRDAHRAHVPMIDGFEPGHNAMTPVFTYAAEGNYTEATRLADRAFELFNAPEELLTPEQVEVARRYRALRLRSLSVGDLIQVGNRYLAVDHSGFSFLDWEDIARIVIVPDPDAQPVIPAADLSEARRRMDQAEARIVDLGGRAAKDGQLVAILNALRDELTVAASREV